MIHRIILILMLTGGCSNLFQSPNEDNFKIWLKSQFDGDMLDGSSNDFYKGDEIYLAKDIEIKLWEVHDDGSIKVEAVIIAYPIVYFQSTESIQDSLIEMNYFHSIVSVEYAICHYRNRFSDWDLFIGSWEEKMRNMDKGDIQPRIKEIYKYCIMSAQKEQLYYLLEHER